MYHVTRGYFWIAGQRPYRARHQRQGFWVVHRGAQCADILWWNSDRRRGNSAVLVLGSTGSDDKLVLDVPPQTGMDLGCIGARAGETIDSTSAFSRVTIYLTVVTSVLSTVTMPRA